MGKVIISNSHVVTQGQSSWLWRTGPYFVNIISWWWFIGDCASLNRLLMPREFCPLPSLILDSWLEHGFVSLVRINKKLTIGLNLGSCPGSGIRNLRTCPNLQLSFSQFSVLCWKGPRKLWVPYSNQNKHVGQSFLRSAKIKANKSNSNKQRQKKWN